MFVGNSEVGFFGGAGGSISLVAINNTNPSTVDMTSPDGVTWTDQSGMPSTKWQCLAWNGTIFVAINQTNSSNLAATSPDGVTWTSRTMPSTTGWMDVIWFGHAGLFIAGQQGTSADTSPDGVNWTNQNTQSTLITLLACNGSIAVGFNSGSSGYATTPDGINWTQRSTPGGALAFQAIAWNGSVFCVVIQNSTTAYTSPDGINWTSRTIPWAGASSITTDGTQFVIKQTGSNTAVATSPDGTTWTTHVLPAAISCQPKGICWNGVQFIAVGASSTIGMTSSDGVTWTQTVLSSNRPWRVVCSQNLTFGTY